MLWTNDCLVSKSRRYISSPFNAHSDLMHETAGASVTTTIRSWTDMFASVLPMFPMFPMSTMCWINMVS